MAVYRNDPDLNLLGQCSNEELQLLVSILTTDADLCHLDLAFPVLMKQLELMLTSGELNPRHQHCVTLYHNELTCEADTLGTRNIDRSIWRDLMLKSGMLTLMDAEARSQWAKNLEDGDLPAISEANILSTFEQLHHNKQDVFERGIINVFKGLSWDYKTNNPCYFGKRIIVNNLVKHDRWGYSLNWGWRRDQLADLERMLYLLDGKTIPDNRYDVSIRFMDFVRDNPHQQIFEDELFSIRYFQKGSGHITFKRLDLVEKMNDIVVKHYPGMLPAK